MANLRSGVTTFDQSAIAHLRSQLRGALLLPADPEYADARSLWNGMIDRHPAVIARCRDVADVAACVNFGRTHQLPVSIKCGGHNISGLAMCEGGIAIDLSLLRGVRVDAAARRAYVQGGCLLGDIDRATQQHGLAAVLGFVSLTGAVGLTLGGGFGYLTRRFGWSSDQLCSIELVTADGRVTRASEKENADLFWGVRGGGGNFGVATELEYQLHPVGPEMIGGAIAWPMTDAPAVLELHRRIIENAPPELTCVAALRPAPSAPWLAPRIHGKPIVALFVCWTGALEDGEEIVRPLKDFGKPVGDVVQRRSYISQQSLLDATQPKGRRYYWKSEFLPGLSTELQQSLLEHAQHFASPHGALIAFPVDGAVQRFPADYTAAGNRDARLMLGVAASWESAADDAANIQWARAAWQDMRRFSTGGTYVNFLTEEEGGDRIAAAYGDNYARLARVKRHWDPDNLFRVNKNILPE